MINYSSVNKENMSVNAHYCTHYPKMSDQRNKEKRPKSYKPKTRIKSSKRSMTTIEK